MNTPTAPRKRLLLWSGLVLLALVVAAELVCRFVLGLGTPPLYVTDPDYEYRLKPGQDVQRFGNHIYVNQWGMRSPEFEAKKQNPDELRVMVIGDSVVNGGSQIDQSELSTTLLQQGLQQSLGRPVTVGNISAGSWGPGNWLAYVRRHGFFDADVVVLVIGSADASDNPSFAPLDANHPEHGPWLAVEEAVFRYLPRYLPDWSDRSTQVAASGTTETPDAAQPEDVRRALGDLRQFLLLAAGEGRKVLVVHRPGRDEAMQDIRNPGFREIKSLAQDMGLPFTELAPTLKDAGLAAFRDASHHTTLGQQVMAKALQSRVLAGLSPTTPAKAEPAP